MTDFGRPAKPLADPKMARPCWAVLCTVLAALLSLSACAVSPTGTSTEVGSPSTTSAGTTTSSVGATTISAGATTTTAGTTTSTTGATTTSASTTIVGPAGSSTTVSTTAVEVGTNPPPRPVSPQSVKTKHTNLAYVGTSPSRRLDIYLPETGTAPFPVIVQFHGGAFVMGDKADGQLNPVLSALSRGYAVVAVNYRLSWEAKFPAAVYDAKAAVRYIKANALKYNLDPMRIAAWGNSAGGYLAAMLGTSAGVAALEGKSLGNAKESSEIQAVVDWSGPIDFAEMGPQLNAGGATPVATDAADDSWESRFLGRPVGRSPDRVKAADPTTYITGDDTPFLIEHGTADRVVPVQQSQDFAAALSKVLGRDKVTLIVLQGAGHGGSQFNTTQNLTLVLDWLDAHLK